LDDRRFTGPPNIESQLYYVFLMELSNLEIFFYLNSVVFCIKIKYITGKRMIKNIV
jgi:hypothetical protein